MAPQTYDLSIKHRSAARRPHFALAALLLALAGCASMAPDYEQPASPVPQAYPDLSAGQANAVRARDLGWREYFKDPVLSKLIETALENNRDMRVAVLRVDEARAMLNLQRGERFPEFTVNGQTARSRVPGDMNPSGQAVTGGDYRAQVGLTSWELDLWGRVRSLEDAALQGWLATEAGRQAVHVALVSQVANNYIVVRELDERVRIARKSVETRQESYRIFSRRYEVGATSKLDVTQVQTLLTQAQSMLAQLEQQRAVQLHALQQLLGADPGVSPTGAPLNENIMLAELAPGLPSDLMVWRPDIIAAEHKLRAANANIGAARAAFFPRIALTGNFGTASAELDGLFDSGSKAWMFAPTISLPIFDGGRRSANLDVSYVRRDMRIAEYEKAIQTAFREVSDALSTRHWLSQQLEVQLVARGAQTERARLAQMRYDNGSAAYLEVLDAQRDLLDVEQQVVQTRRALLASQIAMYSALGGGLDPAEPLTNTHTSSNSDPSSSQL